MTVRNNLHNDYNTTLPISEKIRQQIFVLDEAASRYQDEAALPQMSEDELAESRNMLHRLNAFATSIAY